MQVSIEKEGVFGRKLTIELPQDQIKASTAEKIKEISQKAKIDGFRTGKVPLDVVRKRFGGQARAEVINDLMQAKFAEVLTTNELIPVDRPEVTDIKDEENGNVTFVAQFEVFPNIEIVDLSKLNIPKQKLELTTAEIADQKDKFLRDYGQWTLLDVETAKAKLMDQVSIDFVGTIDGKEFEGGKANHFKLVLGSKSLIEGFEDGIIGMKVGESKDLDLKFPDDYQAEELAGKNVVFNVSVLSISENTPAELNEELAKKIGADSVDDIDNVFMEGLHKYANKIIIERLRPQVLDALYEEHKTDVPEKLLERYKKEITSGNMNPANIAKEGADLDEQASRAIILDLVRDKIVKQFDVKVDNNRVYDRIMQVANMFGDHQLVFKLYKENQYLLEQIRTLVLDEQISELILDKVNAPVEKLTLADIQKLSKE